MATSRPRSPSALGGAPAPPAVLPDLRAAAAPTLAGPPPLGVGIDTSRYGHYATFLRADLQDAAPDLAFPESAAGYGQLRERLDGITHRLGPVHLHVRLDAAGQYAENLLAFLHTLPDPKTISCGDAQRNKNYRVAVFGHKKSDPVESRAVARYALTERPAATPPLSAELRLLRQVAGRLDAQVRQGTRLVNQLHLLLARTFPELALVTKDVAAGWVLALLDRYPTAAKLAAARPASLQAIPYVPEAKIPLLQAHARASVASVTGPLAEELIRDQVREVRQGRRRRKRLEKLLVAAYRALPVANHLDTIPGIGAVTAAVLTAQTVAIERFATPGLLVAYFGTFPVEESSGIDRDGRRRAPKRMVMCPRGCDLVRRYLWTAALSAAQHNPAVRPLYQRVRAKHPDHPAIAVGHAMRKLLHLVYAVWTTGQPFDPQHYPWDRPAHVPPTGAGNGSAAGHNPETVPERSVVTAADPNAHPTTAAAPEQVAPAPLPATRPAGPPAALPVPRTADAGPWLDFTHLRSQLPLARVLEHLGLLAGLRGRGPQRRGPCPLHDTAGQGRTFSVHLGQNVFQCFDAACGRRGDVIDLWAALHRLPLREAALDLVRTFALEPAPPPHGAEKRNG